MRITASLVILGLVTLFSLLAPKFDSNLTGREHSEATQELTKPPENSDTKFGFLTNLDDTLRQANETQKPVFIYVHDSTCEFFCKSLEDGMEDGRFEEMKETHVLAMLDTKGETAEFCEAWNLKHSNSYVLLMHVGRLTTMTSDGERIKDLSEKFRVANPKKLDTVFAMLKLLEEDQLH